MIKLNNKGVGKFEVLTIFVLVIGIIAFLMWTVLNGSDAKKFDNFKSNAIQLNKAVYTNIDSFNNPKMVYLEDVIDQQFLKKMKSPFSSEMCDFTESKVETEGDNRRFTTLKCDGYLIDRENDLDINKMKIYKVSEWSEKEITGDNVETKELYNCDENGSPLLENYVEGDYLVFKTNKLYTLKNYSITDLNDDVCVLMKKTFYRTKELVEEDKKESK